MEASFRARVNSVLDKARAVLESERHPQYAADVPHVYEDKFTLAECLTNCAVAASFNCLEALGLGQQGLAKLRQWAVERSVTLRLKAEEKCLFDRMEKREVDSGAAFVRDYGPDNLKITDKMVTTITEYFWKFEGRYELFAFAGTAAEDCVMLQERTGTCVIVTQTESHPRPQVKVCDAVDVNITWLLSALEPGTLRTRFSIDRTQKECCTPRRNPQVEEALALLNILYAWCNRVHDYFMQQLFPVQTSHGLNVSSINDESVFVPVVPLFVRNQPAAKVDGFENKALVAFNTASAATIMAHADLKRFLDEQKRSMEEKRQQLAKVFPQGDKLITVAEAALLVAVKHWSTLAVYFEAGVNCIESMLRAQLLAAIGKEVTPVEFANYMAYHNRRLFKEQYQPKAFCYAVRRPDHYPEGILSIEQELSDGSMVEPIQTIVREASLNVPMQFALQPGVQVAFTGDVYLHGHVMHSFAGDKGLKLSLSARARQFSSFLVLVGRITGPGLFDPEFGIIVQNKDDVTIPLDLETIPSAGEFKAATVSISPEQQSFAKMFRGMQLASTLFAVCALQIKPQLEKLLRLEHDSLTKEIRLTQDLLQLFIEYQTPSDMLSFGGPNSSPSATRIAGVKRNVRGLQLMMDLEKIKADLDALDVAEKKLTEAQLVSIRSAKDTTALPSSGASVSTQRFGTRRSTREGSILQAMAVLDNEMEPAAALTTGSELAVTAEANVTASLNGQLTVEDSSRQSVKEEVQHQEMEKQSREEAMRRQAREQSEQERRQYTLADFNIQKESTLLLVLRLRSDEEEQRKRREKEERERREHEQTRGLLLSSLISSSLNFCPPPELERIQAEYAQRRSALQAKRTMLEQECASIECLADVGATPEVPAPRPSGPAPDFSALPTELDARLEAEDPDSALRPTIIKVGKVWNKRSQRTLLSPTAVSSLSVAEQKLEKNACWDLLDSLTRSGGLPIEGAMLHVVMASTHCFDHSVFDTLVKRNVNPIEKVERSSLIVASAIHGVEASLLKL